MKILRFLYQDGVLGCVFFYFEAPLFAETVVMKDGTEPQETRAVPAATIVTKPDFRPKGAWGGLSDGKLLGIDGQPLADHKVYAFDTSYFIRKVEDGISKLTRSEDKDRI